MKFLRIALIIAALLVPVIHGLNQPQVEASGPQVIATGTATLANSKLSLVAGAAFFDFASAATFAPYIGDTIQVCQTSAMGQCIEGVIGNLGTGETLGLDLVAAWNFTSGWTVYSGTINNATTVTAWSALSAVYKSSLHTAGSLYKGSFSGTAEQGTFDIQGGGGIIYMPNSSANKYYTAVAGSLDFSITNIGSVNGKTYITSTLATQQVLSPATTGYWIKAKPSSTNGDAWSLKHASFDPNHASGFTWRIKSSNPLGRNTVSGATTQANTKLSLADGTAFFDLGFTLPAWAKTITITDSAGKSIVGTVGPQGTGETYDTEVITTGDFSSGTGWAAYGGWTIGSGAATRDGSAGLGMVYQTKSLTQYGVYKITWDVTSFTSGLVYINWDTEYRQPKSATGSYTTYLTTRKTSDDMAFVSTAAAPFNGSVDNISVKKVLTPSTTGYWAYSTGTGNTKNWASKDIAFNPSSASGYTYTVTASGSVNPAAVHLATVDAGAMVEIVGAAPVALTGKVARISLVDGTAFVDTDGSYDLSGYVGKYITLTDTSGYKISGWAKAAGTGETLDTEILTNTGFADTTGWSAVDSTLASVGSGQSGNCLEITRTGGNYQIAYQNAAAVNGALYRAGLYFQSGTAGNLTAGVYIVNSSWAATANSSLTTSASWTNSQLTFTATATSIKFEAMKGTASAGTVLVDTATLKKILTPSVQGLTIVSTSQGTTYNWAFKDASFLPNAATFTITITDPDVNLAGFPDGNDTPTRVVIDPRSTSAATAALHPYLLVLEDSAGKVATGYIGSAGAGEALAAEKSSGTLTIGNLYKITATEADHFGTGFVVDRYFGATAATACDANNKVQQVTEVSAVGVHLHSTPYSTDRKLVRQEAGFNPKSVVKFRVYRNF